MRWVLNEEIRKELAKPMGRLIEGEPDEVTPQLEELVKDSEMVIAIGDVLVSYMNQYEIRADIYIIDNKNKRKEIQTEIPKKVGHLINLVNPPGEITEKAMQRISDIIEIYYIEECLHSTIFVIDGEEDLLALPAIRYAPVGSKLLYGQPEVCGYGSGVVIVDINKEIKRKTKDILYRMSVE